MFEWLRVRSAAKRMGLRDRGSTQIWYEIGVDGKDSINSNQHEACRTRTRIGITKNGAVVRWCYRCEIITFVVKPAKQKAPVIRLVER